MRDSDVLDKNPHISRSALEAIHGQLFGWALSRSDYDRAVAEDLVQQAYRELLTGKARFDNKSSLKTFVFSVAQNLARSRYRRIASRLRLVQVAGGGVVDDAVQPVDPDEHAAVWTAVQACAGLRPRLGSGERASRDVSEATTPARRLRRCCGCPGHRLRFARADRG